MRITSSFRCSSYYAVMSLLMFSFYGPTNLKCCHGRQSFFQHIRRFCKIRGGESESYPASSDHQQRNHGRGFFEQDLPHDLSQFDTGEENEHHHYHSSSTQQSPNNDDTTHQPSSYDIHQNILSSSSHSYHNNNNQYQHQSSQQQQQQQLGPPPFPPGSYGDSTDYRDDKPPPLPTDYHHPGNSRGVVSSMLEPPFLPPDDVTLLEDEMNAGGDAFFTDGSSSTSTTTNDNSGGMDLSASDKEYILKGLAKLYKKKILPLELASRYGHFHSPPLSPADFVAPPMVLLLGQYSVGKTSFIKYLAGRDFPGIRVGPEPTTDRFTAVLWGANDKIVPGAALCSQTDRPFTGLGPFGNNFLSRLEGVELDVPILRNVTLVDTPGILSGQKQRSRNYDYESVMKWFGERADLVIVMFDAHKLDISDELKRVMELFIPHSDKIRIVLNKADSISTQQLLRVYGALMWSLGKVMNTPEVSRVYVGSFWDAPLQNTEQADLLQREEIDLLNDIMNLPQQAVMRRINELLKRARTVKVHAFIIHYLRKQLPYTWGKRDKQRRLIGRLESEFAATARRYSLPKGDFPQIEPFRRALLEIKDLSEFPKLDKKLVREMEKVFEKDIPELLEKARNQK